MLLTKSNVKEYIKTTSPDAMVSKDFYEALSEVVKILIIRASDRAKLNGRKTISSRDV